MKNFEEWKKELLFVGNIVQDSDDSVSGDDSESRFNRYIEMLDSLSGNEGSDYALAIFQSIQAVDDYGITTKDTHLNTTVVFFGFSVF